MKVLTIALVLILTQQILSQPHPAPVFYSDQWTGEWIIGYTTNLGNYEYTFCPSVNISNPTNVSQYGYLQITQKAFFAPQSLGYDKWGWWNQAGTIYYNIYTPQWVFLDPEMSLAYFEVTDFGNDYLSVTTPSGPGGLDYYYFLYMKNVCTSGACKAAPQNIGCLSKIPVQQGFNPQQLVGTWFITGIYASEDSWPNAECASFEFDVVTSTPPFYGVKIAYTSSNQTHQVYSTTAVLNTENIAQIFQVGVPSIFVNYFDGSTTAIIISAKQDFAYFLSNSPSQMSSSQVKLFENQVEAANIEDCSDCKVIQFTGCTSNVYE